MSRRAAIYCRISQAPDGSVLGVERQEPACRQLCARLGWEVVEVFVDNDLSASRYSTKPRPSYERMLQAVRDGLITAIVTLDADRLTRRPIENETVIALAEQHGVALATTAGETDLGTANGRFVFRLLGNVAAQESELKSERIRRKCEQMAAAGEDHGGIRAFGRGPDRISVDPVEAALLVAAAEELLAGGTLKSIVARWDEQGVTTTRGQRWGASSLRRLLLSPRTYGARTHHGQVAKHDAFPPIIDRHTWQRLHALLTDPSRRAGAPARYLLTGIASCYACKQTLVGDQQRGRPAYGCRAMRSGCGRITVAALPLEERIVEAVLQRIDGPPLQAAHERYEAAEPEYEALQQRVEEEETALAELVHARFVDRIVNHAAYLAARADLERRVVAARRALNEHSRSGVLRRISSAPGAFRRDWAAHEDDLDWRRAVLQAVLVRVEVGPGRPHQFDPARVLPPYGPKWRV